MFSVKRSPRTSAAMRPRWQARISDHAIALAWAPDGVVLAAAAVTGPVSLFDGATGQLRVVLPGHDFGTTAIGFSSDGAHFASCGQDRCVRLWDPSTGRERHVLDGGAPWVERLAWCPVENLLATSAGRKLCLWHSEGSLVRQYPDHSSTIADIQWKPKSRELASASYGCVALFSPNHAEPVRRFEWQGSQLTLAWSPDGNYLATGDQDCTVHFWIVKDGEDLQMSGYSRKVRELAWDSGSRFLATGGGDSPCVWDCSGQGPAGTRPTQLQAHEAPVAALAYQRRGPLLASAGEDGLVAVWDPLQSHVPRAAHLHGSGLTSLAWSPDDTRLAIGTESGTIAVHAV